MRVPASSRAMALAIAAFLLIASGCSTDEADPHDDPEAPGATTPLQGPVAGKMREVVASPKMLDKGAQLFATCAGCHGPEGGGIIGVGPRLNSETFLAAASDDMLIRTIREGRPGTTMVAWGESLGQEDIYALVAHMRSWAPVSPAKLDESPVQGDAEAGRALFADICAACHGASGAGYQETANGTGIGRQAFLSQVSNGYLRYIIRHGKSQTKMKGFDTASKTAVANLSDQQIENVITHLRTSAW